jgi:hypothetical protein
MDVGLFQALTNQYAGQYKWEAELKKQDDLLHTREWKGQSNYTLERFLYNSTEPHMSPCNC